MIQTVWVGKVLSVAAIVVTAMVAVELRGTLPGAATLAFLGFAPGLALSLHMGPMAGEARLLISVVGSAAVGAVISIGLLYTDLWSATTRLLLHRGRDGSPRGRRDPTGPNTVAASRRPR